MTWSFLNLFNRVTLQRWIYVLCINCQLKWGGKYRTEMPHERTLHFSLRRPPSVHEPNVKSTAGFSYIYFQKCMREWNQLDETSKSSPTISVFKRDPEWLVRPTKKSFFGMHVIKGVRLLTRLQVQLSDLLGHKFRHKFQCSNPICFFQIGTEINEYFFLHCPRHSSNGRDLLHCISNAVDLDLGNLSLTDLCNLLHFKCCWPRSRKLFPDRPLQFTSIW